MAHGYVSLLLHAHLPYVRHPEHENFLEEAWLFEAITECYLPLIEVLDGLHRDRIPGRLSLSLSPTLMAMLEDPLLRERYRLHVDRLRRLADREVLRTASDSRHGPVAQMYRQRLNTLLRVYEDRCHGDVVAAFVAIAERGQLELLTCGATHAFLPLFKVTPELVRAQLVTAGREFRRVTGMDPAGVWLPECGYFPGLERVVAEAGFRYFHLEAHGVLHGSERPRHGVYAPVACDNGVAAFGRDPESSRQVWSSREGYPGDPWYREFYRDIGFDLPLETIAPYLPVRTQRIHTGFKYHRVTGPTDAKEAYEPHQALTRVIEHAADFRRRRRETVERVAGAMGELPPLIVAPYDAELFGHWWYEGPAWLDAVVRQMAHDPGLELLTPGDYLERHPRLQRSTPSASSWGEHGYSNYWLNDDTEWIYPLLHRAVKQVAKAVGAHGESADPLVRRALRQAGRELMLAAASDWPFIMHSGTTVEYAERQVRDHLARVQFLLRSLNEATIDQRKLAALELLSPIFPHLDVTLFGDLSRQR